MGLFSGSQFDSLVDKATSEENTTEDWSLIMSICDLVSEDPNGPKECLKSICRRLNSTIPRVVMQSLVLIDACVNNCGKSFHLEIASREFETQIVKIITQKGVHPYTIVEKAKELLEKWAKEFKNDPQLSLISDLYSRLKKERVDFSSLSSKRKSTNNDASLKNPDAVSSAEEEAQILKAIELSMKDVKINADSSRISSNEKKSINSGITSIYPSIIKQGPAFNLKDRSNTSHDSKDKLNCKNTKEFKVRALYDFEAAEENELTFKAGEIILVSDNSDTNWWKGSNHRGDGLFPSNFVSTDLNAQPDSPSKDKKVQFKDDVKVVSTGEHQVSPGAHHSKGFPKITEIDESRMDRLLYLLHEADPHSEKADSDELLALEEQCLSMIPLIDRGIEIIDKEHTDLSELNDKLSSALTLYHDLMKESMAIEKHAQAQGVSSYPTGYAPSYGPIVQNGQYMMSGQQFNGPQYPQYGGVNSGTNFYQGTNIQSQQYPIQASISHPHGQQAQQAQQTVISQVQPQLHQHPLPPYGQNSYPTQSISATNGDSVSQTTQDPSIVQSGSVVNLL